MFNPLKRQQISPLPEPSPESYRLQTKFSDRPADIGDKLPEPARQKLAVLRDEAEAGRSAARAVYDRMRQTREDAQEIERKIREITQRNVDPVKETDPRLIAERENLARFLDTVKKLTAEHGQKRDAAAPSAHILAKVANYLEKLGSRPITMAKPTPTPTLAKGETVSVAIEKVRKRIGDLQGEVESVVCAPIHSSEAKKIARAAIEKLAAEGRPDFAVTVESGREPNFQTKMTGGFGAPVTSLIDAAALVAWIAKDAFIAAAEREIDANSDDANSLGDEERADRIAGAKREILSLERQEEAWIEAARASGLSIARRPDADPRALLGLADTMPEQIR